MSTKIEWATETWNPITGCTPISEGCQNCYAKRMSKRLAGRYGYPEDDPFKVTFHPDRLDQPLKWKKPRKIFVCSMSDLFHKDVADEWIGEIIINASWRTQHTFLILTKRPQNIVSFFKRNTTFDIRGFPGNVWIGVTVENQKRADERIPILLQIPAAVHFVSIEPMLGAIDLNGGIDYPKYGYLLGWHVEPSHAPNCDGTCGDCPIPVQIQNPSKLDWVICGGETGPGARPMHPDWVRSLRDQCVDTETPFFMKQMSGKTKIMRNDIPEDLMIREFPNV